MDKKITTSVVKGLVISLVLIVFSIVGQVLNLETETWYGWLTQLFFFGSIIASCIIYSNQNNNNVTFGNVFADGFKTTAVVTCITIAFTVLMFLIMPELKQKMIDLAATKAEAAGASDEIVEKQQEMFKSMFWVFVIGGVMVTYVFIGALASLIGAAVAKKKPLDPFQQPL